MIILKWISKCVFTGVGVYWIHLVYLFIIKPVISPVGVSTPSEQKARQRCKENRGM
jgi:hypothetical protein